MYILHLFLLPFTLLDPNKLMLWRWNTIISLILGSQIKNAPFPVWTTTIVLPLLEAFCGGAMPSTDICKWTKRNLLLSFPKPLAQLMDVDYSYVTSEMKDGSLPSPKSVNSQLGRLFTHVIQKLLMIGVNSHIPCFFRVRLAKKIRNYY